MSPSSTAVFTSVAGDAEADSLLALARLSRVTLLVGAAPLERGSAIRDRLEDMQAASGTTARREVVLVLDAWDRPPLRGLGAQLRSALAGSARLPPDAAQISTYGLAPTLAAWQDVAGSFLIVLARFEQFLRAEPGTTGFRDFEDELVRLVNDASVSASVVIALSEDAEALFFERFGERLPDARDARIHLQTPLAVSGAAPVTEAIAMHDASSPSENAPEASAPQVVAAEGAQDLATRETAPATAAAASAETPVHERPSNEPAPLQAAQAGRSPAEPRVHSGQPRAWFAAWDRDRVVRTAALPVALVQIGLLVMLLSEPADPPAATAVASTPGTSAPAPAAQEPHDSPHTLPEIIAAQEDEPTAVAEAADSGVEEPAILPDGYAARETPPAERIAAGAARPSGAEPQKAAQAAASPKPAAPPPPATAQVTAPPGASVPAVYVHVRNEAQRAWVQQRAPLLAQHGIRVSGIKVVSEGPRVADLRYFRPEERQEASEVARALRKVGLAPRHVKHIGGFERQATPRQYELWLPASGAS